MSEDLFATGFQKALEVVRQAATPEGFVASTTDHGNYKRIWGRDGVIVSLAALMTEEADLHAASLATLRTLMNNQGPHGEIPSNVDPREGRVSYGGTAGRVDANLWFVIGVHQYWKITGDGRVLEEFQQSLDKIQFLLGAWEFNTKGLLYIPETGDWSDEYLQHGYVLYDQLLYWRALSGLCEIHAEITGFEDHVLSEKAGRLAELIRANYWLPKTCNPQAVDAYHPVIYEKGCNAAQTHDQYWMSSFSPSGYNYRFDGMANALALLFDVANPYKYEATKKYIAEHIVDKDFCMLPAFFPVIAEDDPEYSRLQTAFSFEFRNKPYEYHNNGLWPLINGFYVAALAKHEDTDVAKQYLAAIHEANKKSLEDEDWGFYEYLHGKTLEPGGTRLQTWSASAALIGHLALEGKLPL